MAQPRDLQPSGPSEEMFLQSTGVGARRETDMQSFQPLATSSWKRYPTTFVIPSNSGFPTRCTNQRPRMRLSLRKAAPGLPTPLRLTGNPEVAEGPAVRPSQTQLRKCVTALNWARRDICFNRVIAGGAFFKPIAWRQPPPRGWLAGSPTGGQDSLDSAHSLHRIWHSQDRCALQGRRRPRRRRPPPGLAPE